MINFDKTEVFNLAGAIRGMRNPMASHDKSDSSYMLLADGKSHYDIGDCDMDLAQRLARAGAEHRKFLRQIFISVDIVAPLYWWKQYDTYKIGTVANSYSTMHKIHAKEFDINDFSYEDMTDDGLKCLYHIIDTLNIARNCYLNQKNKQHWFDMIKLLPESYNQKRTVTMNYENVLSICLQRKGHKLNEWNGFREWAKTLPYANQLLLLEE